MKRIDSWNPFDLSPRKSTLQAAIIGISAALVVSATLVGLSLTFALFIGGFVD